jgi:hypothetical protein
MSEPKENREKNNKAADKAKLKSADPKTLPRAKRGAEPYSALLDYSFSVSKLVVILVGIITAGISVVSGATVLVAGIRGGLAILAIGIIFWLVNWILSKGSMDATVKEIIAKAERVKLAQNEEDVASSTVIKSA